MRAIHISQRKYTNKRSSMLKICAKFDCNTIIGPLFLHRAGKPPIIVDAKKKVQKIVAEVNSASWQLLGMDLIFFFCMATLSSDRLRVTRTIDWAILRQYIVTARRPHSYAIYCCDNYRRKLSPKTMWCGHCAVFIIRVRPRSVTHMYENVYNTQHF